MRFGGFGVGRWLGFRVRVDVSWFVVLALVTWTFAAWELPGRLPGLSEPAYLAMGLAGALLLFLSVLLHELSHSVVARSRGVEVQGITLFIFGGVAEMTTEARTPADELALTAAGPLASLLLAGAFGLIAQVALGLGLGPAATLAGVLSMLNLVLAAFNMVPAFPLDGGRILRAGIWKLTGNLGLATRWATGIGRAFGWLMITVGLLLFLASFRLAGLHGAQLSGVWMVLLGWFLNSAASAAARYDRVRRGLEGVPVRSALRGSPPPLPAELGVQELVRTLLLVSDAGGFAVYDGEELAGAVTAKDVSEVPPERRGSTALRDVMEPAAEVRSVPHDAPLAEVVSAMRTAGRDRVFVVRGAELLGVLTLRDVSRWLERVRELGLQPGEAKGDG
jgi:Zn-dependent protease/CBS domain-containing protein